MIDKRKHIIDNILSPEERDILFLREKWETYQELGRIFWKERSTMLRKVQKIERTIAKEIKKLEDFENMLVNFKEWDGLKIDKFFDKEMQNIKN